MEMLKARTLLSCRHAALVFALGFVSSACSPRELNTYEQCRADPTSQCCVDSDCNHGSDAVCDYEFSCGYDRDGNGSCGPGVGTRVCVPRCVSDVTCTQPNTSCQTRTHFQGTDNGRAVKGCFPNSTM